jgi:multiple sugar transport system permease protein
MRALASNAIGSSFTPNLYAYSLATAGQQTGYAAAVSFVLGAFVSVVSLLCIGLARRGFERTA